MQDNHTLNITSQAAIGVMREKTQSGAVLIQAIEISSHLVAQPIMVSNTGTSTRRPAYQACMLHAISHTFIAMSEPQIRALVRNA
jgi:hypothetical protein